MARMIPRERVLTAFRHKEPDRIPIEFGMERIEDHGYRSLCKHLHITDYEEPVTVPILSRRVYNVDDRVRDRLSSDFREVWGGIPMNEDLPGGLLRAPCVHNTIWKRTAYFPSKTNLHESAVYILSDKYTPLHNVTDIGQVEKHKWSDYSDPIYYQGLSLKAKKYSEETDYAVLGIDDISTVGLLYSYLFGFDRWLLDMKLRPDFYHDVMEIIWEKMQIFIKNWYNEAGDYIDVARFYDDVAGQDGLFMSRNDFQEFVGKYWKRYLDEAKKYTHAKFLIHECGCIHDIYPDIIEQGWDGHEAVHTKAQKMDPERIKKEFGDRILFYGGLDVKQVLPFGNNDQIRQHVRELITELGPNGGYIFSTTHMIGPEVSPDKIVAAYDAAVEFGRYPIK